MYLLSRIARAIKQTRGRLDAPPGHAVAPVNDPPALERSVTTDRLKTDFTFFCNSIERLAAEFDARPEARFAQFDAEIDHRIDKAAHELRDEGVAYWRGFFTNQGFLDGLGRICRSIGERSEALNVQESDVIDPESKWHYQGRNSGRSRAIFPPPGSPEATPPEIEALMKNAILREVIARAFKTPAHADLVVPEYVVPTTAYEQQWWHIDRVYELAKVMILASAVTERNGPMKIIPRSHRFEGPRRLMEFTYFREGADFSDVPISLVNKQRKSVELITGKPGDVTFFNTTAYHATGRAEEGERLTATVYFLQLSTPRNEFLNSYHPGYHI